MPVSNSDIDRFPRRERGFLKYVSLALRFCKSRRSVSTRRRVSRRRILASREKPLFESFLCPFSAEVRVC